MELKKEKYLILLIWFVFTGFLWSADRYFFPISTSILCLVFCLMGCIGSLYRYTKYSRVKNIIIDKKSCYETLINNTEDTILLLDTSGTILLINTTGAKRLGVTSEALVGTNAFNLIPENNREFRYKKFQYVVSHKKTVRFVDERDNISLDQILTPVLDCNGKVICVAVYARDITGLIKIEKQLQAARLEAENANAAKSIFLTHVSHELRTPLNVILGYTQILQTVATLEKDEQKSLSKIHKNVEFIISLIDDILDLSKIESSNMSLSIDVFEFNEFLGYIFDIAMMYKQEKGVDFKYHYDHNLPAYVKGDERRLKQVLLNLLVNAFKYTKQGQVYLRVVRHEDAILFRVEDTGIGIDETLISEIFTPFYRIANQSEGFGLGLSIARHLVEIMGGKLQVESAVGKGSSFWFCLFLEPVNVKTTNQLSIHDPVSVRQDILKKILIVDDLKDNRTILKAMIKPFSFEIKEAATGEAALKCIQMGFHPDLILIDLIMPVMDGFECVHQIKNNYPELNTKVVAVSASTQLMKSDKSDIFDDKLAKPVQKLKLYQILGEHLNIQWQSQDSLGQKPETKKNDIIKYPDRKTCEQLIDYAQNGHITDIKDEMRKLERNKKFQNFINQIEIFIMDLDFESLIIYLKKIDHSD
jgi:PAS domain S-box-containing protein